jgi:hypothetical protein
LEPEELIEFLLTRRSIRKYRKDPVPVDLLLKLVDVARFIHAECSAIKFRGGTVVLYPPAKYQPEVKPLYGKRVHVVKIAEEQHQTT